MYKIIYQDKTTPPYIGGEPYDSKWNLMPLSPIQRIEYHLGGKLLMMEGYEAYNHIIERVAILTRGQRISKIVLMAKKEDDVLKIVFNTTTNELKYDVAEFGKEYNGQPLTGWKQGIINGKPNTTIT